MYTEVYVNQSQCLIYRRSGILAEWVVKPKLILFYVINFRIPNTRSSIQIVCLCNIFFNVTNLKLFSHFVLK